MYRDLIFKLAYNHITSRFVTDAIAYHFDKLPPDVRNQLLLKLADDPSATPHDIALTVDHYFDKLPPDVRNQLLLKLADKKEAVDAVRDAVDHYFDKLPPDVRNQIASKLERVHHGRVYEKGSGDI